MKGGVAIAVCQVHVDQFQSGKVLHTPGTAVAAEMTQRRLRGGGGERGGQGGRRYIDNDDELGFRARRQ